MGMAGKLPGGINSSIVAGAVFGLPLVLASPAFASCRAGNPTANDYVCSGTTNNPAGDGLTAASTAGNVSVNVRSGPLTGTANGVAATTTGFDTIGVTVNGNVTGVAGAGIGTRTDIGYSQIDIGSSATVTGAIGVQIITNGAYGILNNNGAIVGTGSAGLSLTLGVGSESVNNNGTIFGKQGTAVSAGLGAISLNNNEGGLLDGAIAGRATTIVNNFGIWQNAGGSTVGTVTSSGTLSLGATGVGTLNVLGDATFAAGSKTVLNIAPDGTGSSIAVAGDAALGGALVLHGTATIGYATGTRYTLLTSGGVVSGTFANVTTDIPKFLPILAMSGTDLSVTLAQYDFREFARTRNQLAAATMIAQAPASTLSPAGANLLLGLNALTPTQLQAGFTQIAGDGLTAAKSVALRQGAMFQDTIADQQAFWRSRETVDPNGITVYQPMAYAPLDRGPGWYAGQIQVRPPPPPPPPIDRSVRMWISGYGGQGATKGNATDGSAAQSGRVGGGAVGVDAQLGRNLLLGIASGYSVGSFTVADRQTSGANSGFHVAMYTGFTANGFYGSATAGYAGYSTTTDRTVGVASLPPEKETGAYSSREYRVRMETGKLIDLGVGSITPFAAIGAANLTSNPYVETSVSAGGAGVLGLAFLQNTVRSVPVEIGFRAETRLRMGQATLAPWAQVSLVHDFAVDRTNTASLAIFPGVPQTVYGARDARDTLRMKGGAQLTFSARAALFVTAEASLSREARVYSGKGGFRYGW